MHHTAVAVVVGVRRARAHLTAHAQHPRTCQCCK
jgi:hypothetical protein